jgi:hypothetical protein
VAQCETTKRRLVTGEVPPGVETVRELDAISNTLCLAIDAAELARNVHHREVSCFFPHVVLPSGSIGWPPVCGWHSLSTIHPSTPQDWREAAEAAFAGLSGYIHELNTDVGLYRAVRRTVDDAKIMVGGRV